jgi:hypothetical protein
MDWSCGKFDMHAGGQTAKDIAYVRRARDRRPVRSRYVQAGLYFMPQSPAVIGNARGASPPGAKSMTARKGKEKEEGKGSTSESYGGKAGQRVRQFAIERGIDVPPPARRPAKKAAKKAAAKPVPRGSRNTTR